MGPETEPIIDHGPENFTDLAENFAWRARRDGMSPESVAQALTLFKADFTPGIPLGKETEMDDIFLQALHEGITPEQIEKIWEQRSKSASN